MADEDDLCGKRYIYCVDGIITAFSVRANMRAAGFVLAGQIGNGLEAVDLVLQERPDIVLMEASLFPGNDGLETVREIMAHVPTCIVMLMRNTDAQHREKARAAGVSGYYLRPIVMEGLLATIKQSLQTFRARQIFEIPQYERTTKTADDE